MVFTYLKRILALSLILATPAYAGNAVTVHTGDVVEKPFDGGTLLDKDTAKKVSDDLIEGDSYKKENESYQRSIQLYKDNERLYQDESNLLLSKNVDLTKALNDNRSMSDWEKVGFFALGLAVAGLAVYGAGQLRK